MTENAEKGENGAATGAGGAGEAADDDDDDENTGGSKGPFITAVGYVKAFFAGFSSVVLIVILGFAVFAIGKAFFVYTVILDPFEIPKEVQEKFITSTALAQQFSDAIQVIQLRSQDRPSRRLLEPSSTVADVQIPGSSLSVLTVIHYLKAQVGSTEVHVTGELTQLDDDTFRLSLRTNDRLAPAWSETGHKTEFTALLDHAAQEIVRRVDPNTLASYLFDREAKDGKFTRTLAVVKDVIVNGSPADAAAAYNIWGNISAQQKHIADAIAQYQQAATGPHASAEANVNLGDTYLDLGRYEAAIAAYVEATRLDPGLASAYLGWGNALSSLGQFDRARLKFAAAAKRDTDTAWPLISLGDLDDAIGQHEAALADFAEALKFLDLHAVNLVPYQGDKLGLPLRYADYLDSYGYALTRIGRPLDAIEKLEQAVATDPHAFYALTHLADALQLVGRRDEAIAVLRRALVERPSLASPNEVLGTVLGAEGRWPEAEKRFETAMTSDRYFFRTYYDFAVLRSSQGRFGEAAELMASAGKFSRTPDAFEFWGAELGYLGEFDAAMPKFECSLALSDKQPMTYIDLADLLSDAGYQADADRLYRRALDIMQHSRKSLAATAFIESQLAWDQYWIAYVELSLNHFGDAEAAIRRAFALDPTNAEFYDLLGLIRLNERVPGEPTAESERKLDDAQAAFEETLRYDPMHAVAHIRLGQIAEARVGKDATAAVEAATVEYQKALQINPRSPDTYYALASLYGYYRGPNDYRLVEDEQRRNLAIGYLGTALLWKPTAEGHRELAELFAATGDANQAAEEQNRRQALQQHLDSVVAQERQVLDAAPASPSRSPERLCSF